MKITKKDESEAKELINQISVVDGEKRVIYKCNECGKLFGRRYIPFGIGKGLTVSACLCQLSENRMWNTTLVLESIP